MDTGYSAEGETRAPCSLSAFMAAWRLGSALDRVHLAPRSLGFRWILQLVVEASTELPSSSQCWKVRLVYSTALPGSTVETSYASVTGVVVNIAFLIPPSLSFAGSPVFHTLAQKTARLHANVHHTSDCVILRRLSSSKSAASPRAEHRRQHDRVGLRLWMSDSALLRFYSREIYQTSGGGKGSTWNQ